MNQLHADVRAHAELVLDQRRQFREKPPSSLQDVGFLAFGVDLDELDVAPAMALQAFVQGHQRHGLAGAAWRRAGDQRIQFGILLQRQLPRAAAVGKRALVEDDLPETVGGDALGEQLRRGGRRLEGPHASGRPHRARHRQRVDAIVGADVDDLLPRLQQAAQELDLVFEPVLLLHQHVGRDQVQRVRHDDPHAVDQSERGGGSQDLVISAGPYG